MNSTNALDAAREILISLKELFQANLLLLACVLDTTWRRALEHKTPSSGNTSYPWPVRRSRRFQHTRCLMLWCWKVLANPTLARLYKSTPVAFSSASYYLLLSLTWRRMDSLPSENARVVWRCMQVSQAAGACKEHANAHKHHYIG